MGICFKISILPFCESSYRPPCPVQHYMQEREPSHPAGSCNRRWSVVQVRPGDNAVAEEEEPGPQYWVEQSSCAGHVRVGLAGRANTPQLSQHSGQSASHPLEERSHTDRARVLLPAAGITLVLPGVMRGAARWTATLSAVRSVWIPVLITACWLVVRPL